MQNLILSTHTTEELTGLISQAVREAVKNLQLTPPTTQGEKLLTRRETADKLKISLVTLNDWSKRGLIQSYLIGGRVLYKEHEILASLHQVRSLKY
jgi:DNA-binding transcriptional regulator YhcF (GntR family)